VAQPAKHSRLRDRNAAAYDDAAADNQATAFRLLDGESGKKCDQNEASRDGETQEVHARNAPAHHSTEQ
jgi:hypothetical protein